METFSSFCCLCIVKTKIFLVILMIIIITTIINGKQLVLHNLYCSNWNLPVTKHKKTGSDYKGILMLYLTSAAEDERNSDELVITDYTCYVHFCVEYEFKNCFKHRKYKKLCALLLYIFNHLSILWKCYIISATQFPKLWP